MVGGAHALARYTGVVRDTKDLDVFLRRRDCEPALTALAAAGFATDLTFSHWLAKACTDHRIIDLIFSSGNGVASVDDQWFAHAVRDEVLGEPTLLCPPEEMIWSKAFIMERERYDGADIAHLFLAHGPRLDWPRLLRRFGRRWRVLLSHLILFGFIYPGHRSVIPDAVMSELLGRLRREQGRPASGKRVCEGTVLSRQQYLPDVTGGGFVDGRLAPRGEMTATEIADWTAAITRPEVAPARFPSAGHSRASRGRR